MDIKDYKHSNIFKSVPIRKENKEKYFIVETRKHNNNYSNNTNNIINNNENNNNTSNLNNFNMIFTTTKTVSKNINNNNNTNNINSNINNTNVFITTHTNSINEKKRDKNNINNNSIIKKDSINNKTKEKVNNYIEKNKLYFNELWNNKVNGEDMMSPINKIGDLEFNLEINKIGFDSINKLATHINILLNDIEYIEKNKSKNNDQIFFDLLICLSSLNKKIQIFNNNKNSHFKYNKENIKEVIKIKNFLQKMKDELKNEFDKNIKEIYETINEFCGLENNN
jgi:CUB/sushi domain-containing protein